MIKGAFGNKPMQKKMIFYQGHGAYWLMGVPPGDYAKSTEITS